MATEQTAQMGTQAPVAAGLRGLAPSLDQLWFLLVLAIFAAFASLSAVEPNDFWWHLRAGQVVDAAGVVPSTQRFAWTLPAATPYTYATWLGEWLYYRLYALGGPQLAVFARNSTATLAFGLMGIEARRRSGSWRLAAFVLLLAGLMSANNLTARTQNWSWLPFVLFAALLARYSAGMLRTRSLAWLPLLMAFWVNAHGAFVLGIGMLGIYAGGETLRRLLRQPGGLPWQKIRWLYLALLATVAATLLNPQGLGIFGYVADLLTDAPSQQLVVEWQPPTTHSLPGAVFYGSLLLLAVSWAYGRKRPSATDALLFCAFAWLAWGGVRYVMWFALIIMPLLAQSLASLGTPGRRRARRSTLNLLPLALLLLIVAGTQPWLKPLASFSAEYREQFVAVDGVDGLFSKGTPAAATEYLRQHPGGRLFHEMGYGSYLIWALPEQGVFIDPRVELYPLRQWHDYIAISEGRDYARLLAAYGVDRVLLSRTLQEGLAKALAADAHWRREYGDEQAEIWRLDE